MHFAFLYLSFLSIRVKVVRKTGEGVAKQRAVNISTWDTDSLEDTKH